METRDITFKNLPFVPVVGQVIYVEPYFNSKLNMFIQDNYEWLKKEFRECDLDFCYLPLLADEVIRYNKPYLNTEEKDAIIQHIPSLSDFCIGESVDAPSLFFALVSSKEDEDGIVILKSTRIDTDAECFQSAFLQIAYQISDVVSQGGMLCDSTFNFDPESQMLVEEIRERIEALRCRGVNTMFLHDIIDEKEPISELHITDDYRIFLPDYGNVEIKMPTLVKAVFFLFLNHPEGIRFKDMPDHRNELLNIYKQFNPKGDDQKHLKSIEDVTDPSKKGIIEKCARIREAFITHFDDRLAKNYYVTGIRGEAKSITLDRSKVVWVD